MLQVAQFDFTSLNYVTGMHGIAASDLATNWQWSGPSQPVENLALSVMGSGNILQIDSPSANGSWTLDFWGPRLQCNDVVGQERDSVYLNIWDSYSGGNGSAIKTYTYLSWVPWFNGPSLSFAPYNSSKFGADPNLPFLVHSEKHEAHYIGPPPGSVALHGPASVFVGVFPQATYFDWSGNVSATSMFEDATLLRCDLVNTSYLIDFKYMDGRQHVNVMHNLTSDAHVVNTSAYFTGPRLFDAGKIFVVQHMCPSCGMRCFTYSLNS
jgi:hypothetical protein